MILFVVSENVLCFKCKSSPKQTNKQTKLFKNYHFTILTKFYYSSRDPDWTMAVRAREEWLRVTVVKIGEVVEEDHELKRFMLSVEVHARENGLIWPEMCSLKWVDLKEALGGGSGGAQFATALRRLAKVDEEERLQQGGFQCSCGEIFAFQRYQICHEKKHQRNIEIEQQRTKNNVGQYGAKDDPIELSDAEEEEVGEVHDQNEVVREAPKKRKTVTIPCKECELKFDRKGRLEKHMNAVHLKVNSSLILCNTCGRGFRHRANFEKHERTSSACVAKWKCEPCKKVFSSKQKLDVHLKSSCHAKVGNMQGEAKRKSENGESDEFEDGERDEFEDGERDECEDEEKEEDTEVGEVEEGEVREWLYNQEGFVCPFCETSFESEKVIGEHINSQHKRGFGDKNIAGEELDEDDEMMMSIGEYDELNTQEDEEDEEEEVKKEVKKARKRIRITDIADQLMEKKAKEVVKFLCGKCGKAFGFRSNLRRHNRMERNACLPKSKYLPLLAKSKYLPEGWTFRIKKRGWIIMTSDKTRLESYIAVQRYMSFKGGFTKNEMKKVYMFPDGENHKTRQN